MKKRTKRILAMLLASAMILQQGSTVGVLATETEPVSETVETTAETQSETTAPETQAPETTAETKAPETQATEAALGTTQTDTPAATQTESDAAQTQQSETVAAMQTEQSETVAETISSTQQSETVSHETTEAPAQTEEKTETPTEAVTEAPKTNFTYEDSRVKITAVAQAAANLPQDAQIHADYMAPGTAAYNAAAAALEAAYAGQDVVLNYVFYDIYFTAASAGDGRIEPEAGTVFVSMQFKKPELTPEEDVEVQAYDVMHVENGKAQEVPSTVQTTGDGSVASVGFTSSDFSPYAVVVLEEQDEAATIGAMAIGEDEGEGSPTTTTSQNIGDMVDSVEFPDIPVDETTKKPEIRPGVSYKAKMRFKESEAHQFQESGEFKYTLPKDIVIMDPKSGEFEITIQDAEGKDHVISGNSFRIENGELIVILNTSDDDYKYLKNATNVWFEVEFGFKLNEDENDGSIKFSDTVTKEYEVDNSSGVRVEKNVTENKETGKFDYTVKVTADGSNANVTVNDTITGNLLKYEKETLKIYKNGKELSEEEKNSFISDLNNRENGFGCTIKSMSHGDYYEFKYSATLDYSDVNGQPKYDDTKNTVTVQPEGGSEQKAENGLEYKIENHYGAQKSDGTVKEEGTDRIIDWTIDINKDKKETIGDNFYVKDTITSEGMTYYGTGITVTVPGKEPLVIPWNELTNKTETEWEIDDLKNLLVSKGLWTADQALNEYIKITYQTKVDASKQLGSKDYNNNLEYEGERSDSGKATVPGAADIEVKKSALEQSQESVKWKVEITVPAGGLDELVVTELLPKMYINNRWLYDDLDAEKDIVIDGLVKEKEEATRSDVMQQGEDKVVTWTFQYTDETGAKHPGLLSSSTDRIITITYYTKVDPNWLNESNEEGKDLYFRVHTNNVEVKSGDLKKHDNEPVTIVKKKAVKKWENQTLGEGDFTEIDGIKYPIFKYSLTFYGVDEEETTVSDIFDPSQLKLYSEKDPIIKASLDNGQNFYAPEGNSFKEYTPGSVVASSAEDGITLNIKFGKNHTDSSKFYDAYKVEYYLIPANLKALQNLTESEDGYKNTVKWGTESSVNVKYQPKELEKKLTSTENGYAKFTIDFNPTAKDLVKDSDQLVITDVMTNLRMDPMSLVITSKGKAIDHTYDVSGNTLTIVIPEGDEKPLHIEYRAKVIGTGTVEFSNTVTVEGVSDSSESNGQYDVSSAGQGGGSLFSIKLYKYVLGSIKTPLAGAKFRLEKLDGDVWSVVLDKNGKEYILETGDDGYITVSGNDATLHYDARYRLVEIEAPKGFTASKDAIEFVVTDGYSTGEDIYVSGDTIYASNSRENFHILKLDEKTRDVLAGAEFTLYKNPECTEAVKTAVSDVEGKASFSELLPDTYYLRETKAPVGYTLPTPNPVYTVVITSELDVIGEDGLTFSKTEDSGLTIYAGTITNSKYEEKGSLKITKTMTGLEGATDAPTSYEFTVQGPDSQTIYYKVDGTPSSDRVTVTVPANGSVTIPNLPLGTYTITEQDVGADVDGYKLTVTSGGTSGKTGTAKLETNGETVDYAVTNTYTDISVAVTVSGTKTLDGETPDKSFTFIMRPAETPGNPNSDPLKNQTLEASNKVNDQSFAFDSLKFTEAGTYTYEISEAPSGITGILDDTTVYTVTIAVTADETTGQLSAAVTQTAKKGEDDLGSKNSIAFNNTTTSDATLVLRARKLVNNAAPLAGAPKFSFTLTPKTTSKDKNRSQTKQNDGASISFAQLTYSETGTYEYDLTEVAYNDKGYKSDDTVYHITVEVTESDGEKTATVISVTKNEDTENLVTGSTPFTDATITFNNTYTEKGTAELKVQKTYIGKSDKIPEEGFSFVLETQSGAPMPKDAIGDTATVIVSKAELENATEPVEKLFDEIEYTVDGTYTYTIKESVPVNAEDGIKDGILYDTIEYTVTVTVGAGQNGQKSVVVSYSGDGAIGTSASFTNTEVEEQTDATGSVEIKAKKSMKKDADKALIPKFSFELAWAGAKGEAPEGQKLPMTAQPDADGNVKFTLPFTMDDYEAAHPEESVEAKEFKYTLKELAEIEDEAKGIIYAENVYTVTAVIGEDISDGGKFDVTYTVDGLEGDSPLMEFVNDTTTVKVDKVDEAGNKLADVKLQITVKDAATGEPVDSWTTDDKTHEITGLLETGKTYVLEETEAPTGYAVAAPVEFTIDKDGNVFVGEEKMADNLLTMTDAKLHFNVNKTELGTGDEVAGAELTVYEKQADGTLKKVEGASWTSKKGETHDFGDLLEAGKTYVLREEVAPDGYGYVTDIEFTVEEDGSITTKMTKTADAAGNDVYLVEDAKIKLEVNKKATGTGEELDGAVLELLDKDGKVLDSWTSKKGQTHDFGSKLKAGESYTLRETVAPDGYTCVTDMKFTVAEDGTVTGLDSIKTTDTSGNTVYVVEDTLNKVSIEKVDESGAALSGAKLVVKDADSAVVDSWTTDGKAHEITGLAKGKYTLSEVEAPEGYQVSKDVPFEITGTEMVGSVLSLTMTDTKIPDSNKYSLTVTKHLRLDGVPSELAAKDVTYYVALFSDAEKTQRVSNVEKIEFHNETSSTVTFDKLAEGTYYVGETDENGTLLVSKIVNDEIIFYPEYSGDGKVELEGRDTDKVADFTNVYMKLTNDFYLSGQITVTKKILVNGEEGTSDETYYARLFTDPELTDPLDEILALDLAGNSSASVTVTNLPIGETLDSTRSYYVAETDENGNVLDPDAVTEFEISIDKSEIVLSANNSAQEVVITNSFTEEETETETETEVPKKAAPKTGDDTDFMRYLLLMALSAGICAVAFEEKRRRNRARK